MALLAAVLVALGRGVDQWHRVSPLIRLHLTTTIVALAPTPAILLHPRGDRRHRGLGRARISALPLTVLISFGVRTRADGATRAIPGQGLFG